MKFLSLVLVGASLLSFSAAQAQGKKLKEKDIVKNETPANAKIFFVEPKNHAHVKSPFKVKMGAANIKIRPAGEDIADKTSGHHHLIINGSAIKEGNVVPTDEKHIHFGKGQTETEVTLAPGQYTLTLQFADGSHLSYGEKLSSSIMVHVE